MSKALSLDLRVRALEAVAEGLGHRGVLWCERGEFQLLAQAGGR